MSDPARSRAHQRLLDDLAEQLRVLSAQGLLRRPVTVEGLQGPEVRLEGRFLLNWCSNDYLGLSTHPAVAEAAGRAAAEWGVGARASRLLTGTTAWHVRLEAALAAWYGTEAAIVFPSGYQANLGALGMLLGPQDLVYVDRLSHASLVDAARATRATLKVFPHNDAARLDALLARAPRARRRLIVTEGIFSMEGDRAPLDRLLALARTHEAVVYVDDAHGAFVLGATGRGTPETFGLSPEAFLYMGTLGKAIGCQGGFIVGPQELIEALRNRAKTFIYTTALAVPVAAAAVAALDVLRREPERRVHLAELARYAGERLQGMSALRLLLNPCPCEVSRVVPIRRAEPSHIIPLVVGSAGATVTLSQRLLDRGHWAPAIRPPTVPEGTARIRLSLTALHTEAHIDALLRELREVLAGMATSQAMEPSSVQGAMP